MKLRQHSARRAQLPVSSKTMTVPTRDDLATMAAAEYKVYENRIRRIAARQLLTLHRVRRRDRNAFDYGRYWLADSKGKTVVAGELSGMHAWLVQRPR